jgi:hypothetical protein
MINVTLNVTISVASADDLPWIAALELQRYGPMRAVAAARLHEWYAVNPLGFLVVRDGGERCGHATILPLRPAMLRALVAGTKSENDIRGEDIFAPADRKLVRSLYVESVIAEPMEIFGELVRSFNRHVARLAQPELMEAVYVCPSTPAGDLLVSNLGFRRAGDSAVYVGDYAQLVRWTMAIRSMLGSRRNRLSRQPV